MSVEKHTLLNLVGSLWPILLSLVTIPIYLQLIGFERYGVLAIIWIFVGYFGLFDFGLGRATAKIIAEFSVSRPHDLCVTLLTAIVINLILGLVGGLVIWTTAEYLFAEFFKISPSFEDEINASLPMLALILPMMTVTGVLNGFLIGIEKFKVLNIASILSSSLTQIAPLAIAYYVEETLPYLVFAIVASRFFTIVGLLQQCNKILTLKSHVIFSKEIGWRLFGFGKWVTVSSFISPIMTSFDRILIGGVLGPKSLTAYTIPYQLAERSSLLANALSTSLLPRLSILDDRSAIKLMSQGMISVSLYMTPAIIIGIALVEPFLGYWISSDFSNDSGLVAKILLLSFWVNSIARIPVVYLQGKGRPDLIAKCHILEILPYLILLKYGLAHFGLMGAALAFLVRVLFDLCFMAYVSNYFVDSIRIWFSPFLLIVISLTMTLISISPVVKLSLAFIVLCLTVKYLKNNAPNNLISLKSFLKKNGSLE